MNQEIIAGIILCVIGLCLLFVSPNKIWSVTDKWKTVGGERPSNSFVVITRVLGLVFIVVGVGLLVGCLI